MKSTWSKCTLKWSHRPSSSSLPPVSTTRSDCVPACGRCGASLAWPGHVNKQVRLTSQDGRHPRQVHSELGTPGLCPHIGTRVNDNRLSRCFTHPYLSLSPLQGMLLTKSVSSLRNLPHHWIAVVNRTADYRTRITSYVIWTGRRGSCAEQTYNFL